MPQKKDFIGHFINNEFRRSSKGATFENINPATGECINQIARGTAQDVDDAVKAAKEALKTWRKTSKEERAAIMIKIGESITKNAKELAYLESLDTGKPISEALEGDIPRAALNFKFYAELLLKQPDQRSYTSPDGSEHFVYRQPLGVAGLITPWNLPLYLETWKIAPALAMGNTIVLKPAELTPSTAAAFCEIARDAGLPAGVMNVVQGFGEGEAGEALVAHPGVSCISFTGETGTGRAIMRKAADSLKKVSFELGGKGASVIFKDADLSKAIPTSARAAYRNQGQVCLAGSRLLVEESIAEQVIDGLIKEAKSIAVGDPQNSGTRMGALISSDHRNKVLSYVELAKKEGAKIHCGGNIPQNLAQGAFLEPTVISGVSQQSRLIQEEIFGPVLTVQTFKDLDEALELCNGTRYGLSCSVWTRDEAKARKFSEQADFGMIWVNAWFLRNLETPFGGMKQSGVGREGGTYSFDFFTEWKTVSNPEDNQWI